MRRRRQLLRVLISQQVTVSAGERGTKLPPGLSRPVLTRTVDVSRPACVSLCTMLTTVGRAAGASLYPLGRRLSGSRALYLDFVKMSRSCACATGPNDRRCHQDLESNCLVIRLLNIIGYTRSIH